RLCNEVMAAAGQKGAFAVAAASMCAHGHVGRYIADRSIYGLYVHGGILLWIVTQFPEVILHGWIPHHRDGRIVDLKIPASRLVQIADFFAVGLREVGPEFMDVGIDLLQRIAIG